MAVEKSLNATKDIGDGLTGLIKDKDTRDWSGQIVKDTAQSLHDLYKTRQ